MLCLRKDICQAPECVTHAYFNWEGSARPVYCGRHTKKGMVDVKSLRCTAEGCNRRPSHGLEGTRRRLFCKEHAATLPEMVNLVKKTCQEPGCNKTPSFGEEAGPRVFCKKHAFPGMRYKGRRCETPGCQRSPHFGDPGTTRRRFCRKHAGMSMENLKGRCCETAGCSRFPHFNYPGSSRGRFCGEHAKPRMQDVVSKCCEDAGCEKRAKFGPPGTKRPVFCRTHARAPMIDIWKKQCENCSSWPFFGLLGQPPSHCARHRTKDMVYRPRRRCQETSCNHWATHGKKQPEHCELHALDTERDLVSRPCEKCGIQHILEKGLCQSCGWWDLHGSLHLFKQKEVGKVLADAGHPPQQTDRIIDCGTCGRERPDFLWDAKTHWVIVEVDENQHLTNPDECECKRMMNIHGSLGMPVIFIRFNPDRYRRAGEKRRSAGDSVRKRYDILIRWLEWVLEHEDARPRGPEDSLRVVQLFFDGWGGTGELQGIPTL